MGFGMFKVSYISKNKQGYLIDKDKDFKSLKSAFKYMKSLKANSKAVGQPILERVS